MKHINVARRLAGIITLLFVAAALAGPKQGDSAATSPYGLQQVKVKGLEVALVLPGATLAGYTKLLIEQPIDVTFHKDWDPTGPGSRFKVSTGDQLRIRTGVGQVVYDSFVKELAKGGYTVVTDPGPEVLRVKAQIINLYVTAPDVMTAGRSRTYIVSAGQMTLLAELSDSETGEVLAQVGDQKVSRDTGQFRMSSGVFNVAEAQTAASSWARVLRTALDSAKGIGKK